MVSDLVDGNAFFYEFLSFLVSYLEVTDLKFMLAIISLDESAFCSDVFSFLSLYYSHTQFKIKKYLQCLTLCDGYEMLDFFTFLLLDQVERKEEELTKLTSKTKKI